VRNEGHTPGSGIRAARVSQESLQQRHVSPMLPIPNTCHRRVDQLAQGDGRDKGAEGQGDRFHGPLRGRLVRPHASMRIVLGRPHRQLVLYDGVLRANWVDIEEKMRKKFAHQVGSRVTHSIEMSGEQCVRLATEHNGTCCLQSQEDQRGDWTRSGALWRGPDQRRTRLLRRCRCVRGWRLCERTRLGRHLPPLVRPALSEGLPARLPPEQCDDKWPHHKERAYVPGVLLAPGMEGLKEDPPVCARRMRCALPWHRQMTKASRERLRRQPIPFSLRNCACTCCTLSDTSTGSGTDRRGQHLHKIQSEWNDETRAGTSLL
jgi:hypothetical protein